MAGGVQLQITITATLLDEYNYAIQGQWTASMFTQLASVLPFPGTPQQFASIMANVAPILNQVTDNPPNPPTPPPQPTTKGVVR